jgi:hypothetical protein
LNEFVKPIKVKCPACKRVVLARPTPGGGVVPYPHRVGKDKKQRGCSNGFAPTVQDVVGS